MPRAITDPERIARRALDAAFAAAHYSNATATAGWVPGSDVVALARLSALHHRRTYLLLDHLAARGFRLMFDPARGDFRMVPFP